MTKRYPLATTSRTLDPSNKGLVTVVGKHDRRITDADINLIQDLQDFKRSKVLENQIFSGVLSPSLFQFDPSKELTFSTKAFEVMFNGEVVTIGGNLSEDLEKNNIRIPAPINWSGSNAPDASIYVVYLELWYRALDPASGAGYYSSGGTNYFYPNGCVDADLAAILRSPDDVIDPFLDLNTTSRAQVQWALRVAPVALSYDFEKFRYGLDPGLTQAETIYGRAFQSTAPSTDPLFAFTNLGSVNGDYGLWRAGDGGGLHPEAPTLPTMDGYTYAMPVAVVFQRNTAVFDPATNPFGSASLLSSGSGILSSGVSGRYDGKFADAIYPSDVVDTRLSVSLQGYDWDKLLKTSFVDIINGNISPKISRGEIPGNKPTCLGSTLSYTISVGKDPVANTDYLGPFDNFMNGFGSDERVFYTTKSISINNKSVGIRGQKWKKGDMVSFNLDDFNVREGVFFSYVLVQGLVLQTDGSLNPVLLMSGQIETTGVGSRQVAVKLVQNLENTSYDPGYQNLLITLGVEYPSGYSYNLKKIPMNVEGGRLFDYEVNTTFPVFGVSEYTTLKSMPNHVYPMISYSPLYSNKVFGTRVEITKPSSDGVEVVVGANVVTSFTINRLNLNGVYNGLCVVKARDQVTKSEYVIATSAVQGNTIYVDLAGSVVANTNIVFTVLLEKTCQVSYNAPVKALTAIQETVLVGNYTGDSQFQMDKRVKVVSQNHLIDRSIVVLAADNSSITAVSGDDINKFIFVVDSLGKATAVVISDVQFFNGLTILTVPSTANLASQNFFLIAGLSPAFHENSSLAISIQYLPYQGEGKTNREYSLIHSEDFAYVTTNGSGSAPIVGLKDVYPYNRELPIVSALPAQATWADADLHNQAVSNFFDGNYEAKRFANVEHTFITPLHTNDFIEPVSGWKNKKLKVYTSSSGRGFAKLSPHVGFAIKPAKPRSVLGDNILATIAPITLYINNVTGVDSNDGLTRTTPKKTFKGAFSALPPILRHPCYVFVIDTGVAYSMSALKSQLVSAKLGDGEVQPIKNYCIDSLAFTIQNEGRLYIGREASATGYIEVNASNFIGFGDGPTSAFVVSDTRVTFNGFKFSNFQNASIVGVDSIIDFVDCKWTNNAVAASLYNGCSATLRRGEISLLGGATGFILEGSDALVSSLDLTAADPQVNSFFVCERSSNLTFQKSGTETDIHTLTSDETVVIAKLNSNVVCNQNFASLGKAFLYSNSSITRTVLINPFVNGIILDPSSVIATDIS